MRVRLIQERMNLTRSPALGTPEAERPQAGLARTARQHHELVAGRNKRGQVVRVEQRHLAQDKVRVAVIEDL